MTWWTIPALVGLLVAGSVALVLAALVVTIAHGVVLGLLDRWGDHRQARRAETRSWRP